MTNGQISSLIVDESTDLIYICDPETYELHYMNRSLLSMLGNPPKEEWVSQPCYKVLQNRTSPCPFCTNPLLNHDDFYSWEHYNDIFDRYFTIRDKFIQLNDKKARLEIAVDTTKTHLAHQELKQKLAMEETLISCLQTLTNHSDTQYAIQEILKQIGQYHNADRAYIFEINQKENTFSNTYEWCRETVSSQCSMLQKLPLSILNRWLTQFHQKGEVFISSLSENVDTSTEEYATLAVQDIQSLIAVPLFWDGTIVGFLGVDNPGGAQYSSTLLRSAAFFIINDINRRQLLDQLTQLSFTDNLTGLGSRHKYTQTLKLLEHTNLRSLGVMYLDINGLKQANDTHGHLYGDMLITQTAHLLLDVFQDEIYRIGGDEFVVLCPNMSKEEFDLKSAELRSLLASTDELFLSIGSTWNCRHIDIQKQITHTDELMYIDKQAHYSMEGTRRSASAYRASLSQNLLAEITRGDFLVYLQPKFDLDTGKINGAEALIRKLDSDGNLVPPNQFISRYETEGIIRHIDFYVLDTVCAVLSRWKHMGYNQLTIAVNFSRITLMEHNIVDKLLQVCQNHDIAPELINLEVTESIGTMDADELTILMHQLAEAGFIISLDDFGSEYSNLAILTSLDFHEIKLDRSLINHLDDNQRSRVITEHTIKMCHDLNVLTSVAEGIETPAQWDLLKEFNCTTGQGYYFDKPMPIDAFTDKYISNQ